MKPAMRRQLARQSFEEKIRKVGQLIRLAATVKSSRVREGDESESAGKAMGARQLQIENGRLGLPLISARNGRVYLIRTAATRKAIVR